MWLVLVRIVSQADDKDIEKTQVEAVLLSANLSIRIKFLCRKRLDLKTLHILDSLWTADISMDDAQDKILQVIVTRTFYPFLRLDAFTEALFWRQKCNFSKRKCWNGNRGSALSSSANLLFFKCKSSFVSQTAGDGRFLFCSLFNLHVSPGCRV